jgi:gamma-F420-2:alpha-L-glutamate ligase
MTAWMIYFRDGALYNQKYIEFYIEEGKKLGITVRLILIEELEFGVEHSRWFVRVQGKETKLPDFVICRAIYPLLSRHFEFMGIQVFNNSFVSEICNDKAKTYQYLAKTGIKMVDSSFYRNNQVGAVIAEVNKPTEIKAVDGHGGSQVFLINRELNYSKDTNVNRMAGSNDSAENTSHKDIIKGLGSSDVVVQPLTGNRHQDLRIYVIGKEIIAGVLRTAKEGFKSNFSLGGDVHLYELSDKEKELVNLIISQFDFGLVGIDFIIGDEGELIFNEIEDVVGSRMLYQCSDINIVELYLKYILRYLHA